MLSRARMPKASSDNQSRIFDLMGHSSAIDQINRNIEQVAKTKFTVIIEGETGTGKELVARFIHDQSKRAAKPFVAIDCGAIPDTLMESELFGYEKGAFTGAERKKPGYFEIARGGTLFLDEVANLPLAMQVKLLRSVQERRILPLGSEKSLTTDVRLIAASNAVLENEVESGRFRADLFHRLNEFRIFLLPLRHRQEDILFIAERFRQETNAELHKDVKGFSPAAQASLLAYDWPGNVRELRNTIRRAVLLATEIIEPKQLHQVLSPPLSSLPPAAGDLPTYIQQPTYALHDIVREVTGQLEKALIQQVLQDTQGNKSLAAKHLKIGYKTLHRKLQEHAIRHELTK